MGIDFLEISLLVEEQLHCKIDIDALSHAFRSRNPPDLTVGELYGHVCAQPARCGQCDYDLRAHGTRGRCPECGSSFDVRDREATWEQLRRILSEVLGVEEANVRKESLLVKDLGMT